MLSLGYTLIHNRISESLISRGFYPYEGMYSKKKGYHKALASELMEPFRFIPEKMILYMIHTAQINENDFIESILHRVNTRFMEEVFRIY